ncbi:VanW family protein [Neobacillus sp. SM06]|uniref:VanW family protein n=1 Tax=Neobacillus sp. SM06 TaxID=3422492 RepID=UPI003D2CBD25
MNFSFLFGVFLLIQQVTVPDQIIITHQGKIVSTLNRSDFFSPYFGLPILDHKKFDEYLDRLDKLVYKEPINAALDSSGNIIPEQIGFRLSRQAFTEELYGFYFSNGTAQMKLPILPLYPKVDTELLGHIHSKRIGRYITSFNVSNKTRSKNISLAAKAINNVVVFPGESFSFNKIVGKRTAEKGYLRAPVIIRGEFSEDIGGGICQVSSTLFNAVDNAGLKIIQRFSHTRRVPYIPPGRDATVSWYGPDFVFKNTYNQPILIQAKTLGNYLIIKLYSSDVIQYRPKKVPSLL